MLFVKWYAFNVPGSYLVCHTCNSKSIRSTIHPYNKNVQRYTCNLLDTNRKLCMSCIIQTFWHFFTAQWNISSVWFRLFSLSLGRSCQALERKEAQMSWASASALGILNTVDTCLILLRVTLQGSNMHCSVHCLRFNYILLVSVLWIPGPIVLKKAISFTGDLILMPRRFSSA